MLVTILRVPVGIARKKAGNVVKYGLIIRRSKVRILPGAFIYNGFSAVKKFYIL